MVCVRVHACMRVRARARSHKQRCLKNTVWGCHVCRAMPVHACVRCVRTVVCFYVWMKLTSKSPMVNRVAASESAGGRSGLIIYVTHRHTFIDMVSNCVSVQSNTEMNF